MNTLKTITIDIIKIISILTIIYIVFWLHPLITSMGILLIEIIGNIQIMTWTLISIPKYFACHISKLCALICLESVLCDIFGVEILPVFTIIKINYIFSKTGLNSMIDFSYEKVY